MVEEKAMNKEKAVFIAKIAVPLVIALVSFFLVGGWASTAKSHAATISALDKKKTTVMELTAATTAASAAITLIPGDTATPIANKLMDLSGYFVVVLCAIFLEKYLVTITGFAAFKVLIPIACVLISANVFFKNEKLKNFAAKLALFGLVIFLVVPTSVWASNLIEATYASSVDETLASAKESTQQVEDSATEANGDSKNFLANIISKIQGGITALTSKFEDALSNMIEAVAVLIVTSCLIPIAVLLFFFWIIRMGFGIDVKVPKKLNFKVKKHGVTEAEDKA